MLRQATIRLWLDDFHPAVGLLTLFAAICLGLAIAVRVLLLSIQYIVFWSLLLSAEGTEGST